MDLKNQQRLSKNEELEADRNNILKNSTAKTFELPEIFKFEFDKSDHRWNKKDADITDYFNYGYNEETWKLYVNKVRKMALKLNPTEYRIESQSLPDSQALNELDDGFPIDLGGFSEPFYKGILEGLGENFFDDKILSHCVGRKKYGSLDYENMNLDQFLNFFLSQKHAFSQTFAKLIECIKVKNQEHSEDIYQVKNFNKKNPPQYPGRPLNMPHFPPMMQPYPNSNPQFLPPFMKPPTLPPFPMWNFEDFSNNHNISNNKIMVDL